jgi:hypothetical protein
LFANEIEMRTTRQEAVTRLGVAIVAGFVLGLLLAAFGPSHPLDRWHDGKYVIAIFTTVGVLIGTIWAASAWLPKREPPPWSLFLTLCVLSASSVSPW